jgi:hypothetical protein
MGKRIARAIVELTPGRAPRITPIKTPARDNPIRLGVVAICISAEAKMSNKIISKLLR